MRERTWLGFMLFLVLSACSTADADSVRAEFRSLQTQIDQLRAQVQAQAFVVVFRDREARLVLAPRSTAVVVRACLPGEIVVTGGYIAAPPADVLQVVINAPFFDGVSQFPLAASGWRVDFYNPTDMVVTAPVRINVSCTQGNGRGEP